MPTFYDLARASEIKQTLKVYDYTLSTQPKAGRLYRYQGGLFFVTDTGIALVLPDDQLDAMIKTGLLEPNCLSGQTVN